MIIKLYQSAHMSVQGSKPRKFWRRTNHNNPTFSSSALMGVLINPQIYKQSNQNSKSGRKNVSKTHDSLDMAQQQFYANKVDREQNRKDASLATQRKLQGYDLSNRNRAEQQRNLRASSRHSNSVPAMQRNPEVQMNNTFKRLNFLNFKKIQQKQMHGYNILSNV